MNKASVTIERRVDRLSDMDMCGLHCYEADESTPLLRTSQRLRPLRNGVGCTVLMGAIGGSD